MNIKHFKADEKKMDSRQFVPQMSLIRHFGVKSLKIDDFQICEGFQETLL